MAVIVQSQETLTPPFRDSVIDQGGIASRSWTSFFGLVTKLLSPLGAEKNFQLANNNAVAENINGMSFGSATVSQAIVEYYIQRITTGVGANEIITTGVFHLVFLPVTNSWSLVAFGTPGPSTSGITFSVTATGQVQYTSTNITGTPSISKISWRARTLGGKNYQYSTQGGR